jgi:hypothetical protein
MENLLDSNLLPPIQPVAVQSSRAWLWAARVFTGLVVAFLLADAIFKLIAPAPVIDATRQLGFPVGVIRPLGALLAVFAVLHVIPRTQLLGALLLTAYLGGATATHVRVGTPFWFPVAMGAILWIAYSVRSPNLRALLFSPPSH